MYWEFDEIQTHPSFKLSLLYARMNKIHLKLKALEWRQHFSHYKSIGIFQTLKGRLLISPWSDPAEFRTHLR